MFPQQSRHGSRVLVGSRISAVSRLHFVPHRSHGHSWKDMLSGSHHHHAPPPTGHNLLTPEAQEKEMRVTRWGLYSNIQLTVGKFVGGVFGNSAALIADGFHSVSDMLSDGVTMLTIQHASQPADKNHPYGHGKIEDIGSGIISGIQVATGLGISWNSVDNLYHLYTATEHIVPLLPVVTDTTQQVSEQMQHQSRDLVELFKKALSIQHDHSDHSLLSTSSVALSIAIGCIAIKEVQFHLTMRVAKETKSQIVEVNAWHHRSDSLSSLVAVIGIGGTMVGIPIVDPLAAIVVGAMITKQGYDMGRTVFLNITDHAIDAEYRQEVEQTLQKCNMFGVVGYHALRGRKMGRYYIVDVDLIVPSYLSVSAAHQISEQVRLYLLKHVNDLSQCTVHVDILEDQADFDKNNHMVKILPFTINSTEDIVTMDQEITAQEQFVQVLTHEEHKQAQINTENTENSLPNETLLSVGHPQLMRSVVAIQYEVEQAVLHLQAKQNMCLCVGKKNIIPHFINNTLQVDVEMFYGCECSDSLLTSPETLAKTFTFAHMLKVELERTIKGVNTARVILNLTK